MRGMSDAPRILAHPLPYETRLEPRPLSQVDLVVIHCTELPDLATAREFGEDILYPGSGTGNSGHYYIDRDGSIHQYVALDRVAHHVRGYNPRAVGIELVNTGRYPDWLASDRQQMREPYTEAQIASLIALLRWLPSQVPALHLMAGHEDLDRTREPASDDPSVQVQRKLDPGPLFPWEQVMAEVALERLKP